MPHGTPDWGLVGPKETVYGLDDLAEQAIRLGSPHLFDRRGDVLWLTDFRNGMEDCQGYNVPANGDVTLWTGYARQGAFYVRLEANVGVAVSLFKAVHFPALSRIGLEFSFTRHAQSNYIVAEIHADNGVNELRGFVRYDSGNRELQYLLEPVGPTWVMIADDLPLAYIEGCPHTLKMVVDLGAPTPEYVRAILNNVTYPLTGIPLWAAATSGTLYMWVEIEHEADDVGPAVISIDNVILTQNEP